jgi:Putative prokaryotic signal transducing protein
MSRLAASLRRANAAARMKMVEVLRSNDVVLLSLVEAILTQAGIGYFVADGFASVMDGSLGIIPRRVLVASEDIAQARQLLAEADLAHELSRD